MIRTDLPITDYRTPSTSKFARALAAWNAISNSVGVGACDRVPPDTAATLAMVGKEYLALNSCLRWTVAQLTIAEQLDIARGVANGLQW